MLAVFKRGWVPLIVVVAVVLGGLAVIRLRGVFGSDEIFSWNGGASAPIASINTKQVTYQVFGPGATGGGVSFLNAATQPQEADFATLPWTHTMTTTKPVVVANLVAQGDGDGIGCRITVNGVVKDEQFATGHHAQVFCLVKAG